MEALAVGFLVLAVVLLVVGVVRSGKRMPAAPVPPSEQTYWFRPHQDITAFELAEILRRCQSPHISGAYRRLPPELRRHFVVDV